MPNFLYKYLQPNFKNACNVKFEEKLMKIHL